MKIQIEFDVLPEEIAAAVELFSALEKITEQISPKSPKKLFLSMLRKIESG